MKIENLVQENERTVIFVSDSAGYCSCIIDADAKHGYDINAYLEMTLHRIIDAGGTDDDIYEILGAIPDDGAQEDKISLDLGYVLKGAILIWDLCKPNESIISKEEGSECRICA